MASGGEPRAAQLVAPEERAPIEASKRAKRRANFKGAPNSSAALRPAID